MPKALLRDTSPRFATCSKPAGFQTLSNATPRQSSAELEKPSQRFME